MSDEYKTTSPNGEVVKTREEMAKQANVGTGEVCISGEASPAIFDGYPGWAAVC